MSKIINPFGTDGVVTPNPMVERCHLCNDLVGRIAVDSTHSLKVAASIIRLTKIDLGNGRSAPSKTGETLYPLCHSCFGKWLDFYIVKNDEICDQLQDWIDKEKLHAAEEKETDASQDSGSGA